MEHFIILYKEKSTISLDLWVRTSCVDVTFLIRWLLISHRTIFLSRILFIIFPPPLPPRSKVCNNIENGVAEKVAIYLTGDLQQWDKAGEQYLQKSCSMQCSSLKKKPDVLDVTLTINTTIPLVTAVNWLQFVNVESTTVTYFRPGVSHMFTTWAVMHIRCSRHLLVSWGGVIATTDPTRHVTIATLYWNTMSSHHYSSSTLEAVPTVMITGKIIIAYHRMSSTAPISARLIENVVRCTFIWDIIRIWGKVI